MPNTNFQTFHQMGQAINEVVRQATGRDAVQNIDMDHVTVAQNQYYEEVSVSGSVVSFTDRVGNTPLEKCVVQIEPVQEGSGDPSPENIRPITGWTGANIHVSPTTDAQDGTTYSITFPAEAGTVYGGTLTVNEDGSGTLVVDTAIEIWNGTQALSKGSGPLNNYYKAINNGSVAGRTTSGWLTGEELEAINLMCNLADVYQYTYESVLYATAYCGSAIVLQPRIFLPDCSTVEEATAWLADQNSAGHPLTWCYKLKEPLTYSFTTEQIKTIQGTNNIWADTGDIDVKVKLLKELY